MAQICTKVSPLFFACLTACASGPVDDVGADAGPVEDPSGTGDELVVLNLDSVDSSTEWTSIPMSGQGPAGGLLRYTSTQTGRSQESIGPDGTFCVDVPLEVDVVNTIVLEAVAPSGAISEPVMVEVTQTGAPDTEGEGETEPEGDYDNVAIGATDFDIHASFEDGDFSDVVDDNEGTFATILNNTHIIFVEDFLTFALPSQARVESVVVHSTDDCPMDKFDLFLTDSTDPGPLYTYDVISLDDNVQLGPEWVWVASVEDAASSPVAHVNLGAADATWVGIQFMSRDCGSFWRGKHQISEIEVLARKDEAEGPGPGGPSCDDRGDF